MNIREIVAKVSTWSWPVKFLFGAVVTSMAGGGILTFLLQHAAYSFALTYGFRPPVEGVSYLPPMVTFASVALLLLGAMLSATFIASVRFAGIEFNSWLVRRDGPTPRQPPLSKLQAVRPIIAIPSIVLLATAVSWLEIQFIPSSWIHSEVCAWPLLLCTSKESVLATAVLFLSINIVVFAVLWRPAAIWVATLLIVAGYYIWVGATVLPTEGYGRLLRTTGFGGGLLVDLDISESDANTVRRKAYLLMRTSTNIIVMDAETRLIDEYSLARTVRIRHASGGLHMLPSEVPKQTVLMQR